jgi:hypothetical protein
MGATARELDGGVSRKREERPSRGAQGRSAHELHGRARRPWKITAGEEEMELGASSAGTREQGELTAPGRRSCRRNIRGDRNKASTGCQRWLQRKIHGGDKSMDV